MLRKDCSRAQIIDTTWRSPYHTSQAYVMEYIMEQTMNVTSVICKIVSLPSLGFQMKAF